MNCTIPPGREYAVTHYLAIVPRPQWERYQRTGKFTPGIQKKLDLSAECHVNRAVVVDGQVITGLEIYGFLPWGWYRYQVEPIETVPPDPGETLVRFERDPGAFGSFDPDRQEFGGSLPTLMLPSACEIVPVPTIDQLIPFPHRDIYVRFARDTRMVRAGELGSYVLRIPGTKHPMFSSGLGLRGFDRRFLSPLGRELFDFANQARELWGAYMDHRNEAGWSLVLLWAPAIGPETIRHQWWSRDFAASHMQCLSPNHFFGGTPVKWRWRHGGERSAGYIGDGWDVYEEMAPAGFTPPSRRFLSWYPGGPRYTRFDADGRYRFASLPERIGQRDGWSARKNERGGYDRTERPWQGPPPGAFLFATPMDGGQPGGGGGGGGMLAGLGRSPHDTPKGWNKGKKALYGLGCPTGGGDVGNIFDDAVDVFTAPIKWAGDVVAWQIDKAKELAGEIWQHLPSEVRKLAIEVGPYVAAYFLPGIGKPAAKAALMILENDRNADNAKKALRKAQEEGAIPDWLDFDNMTHVAALARAGEVSATTQAGGAVVTPEADVRGVAAAGGALLLLAFL